MWLGVSRYRLIRLLHLDFLQNNTHIFAGLARVVWSAGKENIWCLISVNVNSYEEM